MKFFVQCAYVGAFFWAWVKKNSQDFSLALGMMLVLGAAGYGILQMKTKGAEHEIDATYLEATYNKEKQQWAMGCIREISTRDTGVTPEAIEGCEHLAQTLYPPKDFSKVAMLNWERQQLGVVIYEEDPLK
ncbi:hypothetical protein D3C80_1214930 [compost metagenome]